jgi:hypothetical protein
MQAAPMLPHVSSMLMRLGGVEAPKRVASELGTETSM